MPLLVVSKPTNGLYYDWQRLGVPAECSAGEGAEGGASASVTVTRTSFALAHCTDCSIFSSKNVSLRYSTSHSVELTIMEYYFKYRFLEISL